MKRTPRNTSNNNHSSGYPSSPLTSLSPSNPRTYFEGNRSESPNYLTRKETNMTSDDYDRNLEVASLGLDLAELQKSQR